MTMVVVLCVVFVVYLTIMMIAMPSLLSFSSSLHLFNYLIRIVDDQNQHQIHQFSASHFWIEKSGGITCYAFALARNIKIIGISTGTEKCVPQTSSGAIWDGNIRSSVDSEKYHLHSPDQTCGWVDLCWLVWFVQQLYQMWRLYHEQEHSKYNTI